MGIKKGLFCLGLLGLLGSGLWFNHKYGTSGIEGLKRGYKDAKQTLVYKKNKILEKEDGLEEEFDELSEEIGEFGKKAKKKFEKLLKEGKKEIESGIFDEELGKIVGEAKELYKGVESKARSYQGSEKQNVLRGEEFLSYFWSNLKGLEEEVKKGYLKKEDFYKVLDKVERIEKGFLDEVGRAKKDVEACERLSEGLNEEGKKVLWEKTGKGVSRESYRNGCLGTVSGFPIEDRVWGVKRLFNSLDSSPEKKKEVVYNQVDNLGVSEQEELLERLAERIYGKGAKICGEEKVEEKSFLNSILQNFGGK